jgi:hypothetical protein
MIFAWAGVNLSESTAPGKASSTRPSTTPL